MIEGVLQHPSKLSNAEGGYGPTLSHKNYLAPPVELQDLENERQLSIKIVAEDESDVDEKRARFGGSPDWRSLIGKKRAI